jgi:hypothetical protein
MTATATRSAMIPPRVRHREAQQQDEQRAQRREAHRHPSRSVGRQPQRDRDREHAHEPNRVPVLHRRAQTRHDRGVVEVDPKEADPRDDLPPERVQGARHRHEEPADRHALDPAQRARAGGDRQHHDERVGGGAVDVGPRPVGCDRPQHRHATPHGEQTEQRDAEPRDRGGPQPQRSRQQPAHGRNDSDEREADLQPRFLGQPDRAVSEHGIGARGHQGDDERGT